MKCELFNNIINLETIDSTNAYLRKLSKNLPYGTVVFGEEQTAGKGRLSRKWFGEKGKSISASFLIKDIYDNIDAIRLSFLFSMAVKSVLTKYINYHNIVMKWPNDILVSGKKICGILSEYSNDCAIVGIGINVLKFVPDEEIGQPWTTIESESNEIIDLVLIKEELVREVNSIFSRYCTNSLKDIPFIWFREANLINVSISVKSGKDSFSGSVRSIDDKGILSIYDEITNKIKEVSFGDVTYND